jgi:hypothetical protein
MLLILMVPSYTFKRFVRASVRLVKGSYRLLFRVFSGVCVSVYYGIEIHIKLFLNNNFQMIHPRCVEYANIYMYIYIYIYTAIHNFIFY